MYISRSLISAQPESDAELLAKVEAAFASRQAADGFRWAMLLRSSSGAPTYVSISMWLTPEHAQRWRQANDAPPPAHGYDVTTARGSMTPATAVAVVDWQVDGGLVARFTNRWNATYHAIEDRIGSRLAQDLTDATAFTAVHVVTDAAQLKPDVLKAQLTDDEGLALSPAIVETYEVVLLKEAG